LLRKTTGTFDGILTFDSIAPLT